MALLEVCVDCLESAINADKSGAARLELCSALSLGGLTPSVGLLRAVKRQIKTRTFVMIRCREGDFVYDDDELVVMRDDIAALKESGADGFVLGVLNKDATINKEACRMLLQAAHPLPCTFHRYSISISVVASIEMARLSQESPHNDEESFLNQFRAFDETADAMQSLEDVIQLGFQRILTSGQQATAVQGLGLIKQLQSGSAGRIIIMAGAGVTEENARRIVVESGVAEIHGSASYQRSLPTSGNTLNMGSQPEVRMRRVTCCQQVARIVESIAGASAIQWFVLLLLL